MGVGPLVGLRRRAEDFRTTSKFVVVVVADVVVVVVVVVVIVGTPFRRWYHIVVGWVVGGTVRVRVRVSVPVSVSVSVSVGCAVAEMSDVWWRPL